MSDEHFTLDDGTLIEALGQPHECSAQRRPAGQWWAPGFPSPDGYGPDACLQHRPERAVVPPDLPGGKVKLAYIGQLLIENRHELIAGACYRPPRMVQQSGRRWRIGETRSVQVAASISGCLSRKCSAITARTPPGPHSLAVMTAK